ncbi:MAG: thiamine pyrophosphate-binding protein [Planctomycetes bacterium]|nr:thiamine pyrophosphate-binding protein [Planctomycetota bacterium]
MDADGGSIVAGVLARRGVRSLFTLCGGHISPILVASKRLGIRVVDVRDEATAVFAADATARLEGSPAAAAVTAGPGVTNSVTALVNARLAQSPVVLLGGATATLLRGRGALQDIDAMALVRPHVKWAQRANRRREVAPLLEEAFDAARRGVPGPVFLELPVDLLYPEATVRRLYRLESPGGPEGLLARLRRRLFARYVTRLFAPASAPPRPARPEDRNALLPGAAAVREAASILRRSERPVLLAGSQAARAPREVPRLIEAIERLGCPAYLSGMARGLLGRGHPLQLRHRRNRALAEADAVVLAGVPCDFRLEYGRHIGREAKMIAANLDAADLRRNLRPTVAARADPARFLAALAEELGAPGAAASSPGVATARSAWLETLRRRDRERDEEIDRLAREPAPPLSPLLLCQAIERALAEDSIVVADGGDFVATASYIVRPRRPLSWLDPGPFGTLGIGAGFALGAKLARPSSEVWILYGDGSAGYSLMEVDTFVRHGLGVIAVIANDGAWMQIARDQAAILGDDVGTVLRRTDYHAVAEGWGGRGLVLDRPDRAGEVLAEAREIARSGVPAVVNAHLGRTEFRKGSIAL